MPTKLQGHTVMSERRRPHKENERQGKKREKTLSDPDKDTDTDIGLVDR